MSSSIQGESVFYNGSPILTEEHMRTKRAAWEAGKLVTSGLVAVGRVIPSTEEVALLGNLAPRQFDIANENRTWFESKDPFKDVPALGSLYRSFISIVHQDILRSGMKGSEDILLLALDPQTDPLNWHIDPVKWQARYTMGLGQNASTIGSAGEYSISDFDGLGDVRQGVQINLQGPFDPGTVLRITLGDVHCTPISPNRIFMRDTFYIAA